MRRDAIERWDLVWSDVQSFDATALEASMSDVFSGLMREHGALVHYEKARKSKSDQSLPSVVRWGGKNGESGSLVRLALTAKLQATFPNWYGRSGWYIGNETFGGCFCHSLPSELAKGSGPGAQWVVGEIRRMLSALEQWAPHIERVEHCPNRAERPVFAHDATLAMIDVMIDSGWLSESWYSFVDDGVKWMLQSATGLPPNQPPISEISSASFAFTSWTGPSSSQKNNFADAVAAVLEK